MFIDGRRTRLRSSISLAVALCSGVRIFSFFNKVRPARRQTGYALIPRRVYGDSPSVCTRPDQCNIYFATPLFAVTNAAFTRTGNGPRRTRLPLSLRAYEPEYSRLRPGDGRANKSSGRAGRASGYELNGFRGLQQRSNKTSRVWL